MVFNRYKRRVNLYGDTTQEEDKNIESEIFRDYVFSSPNYFKVAKYKESMPTIDCTIQDARFNSTKISDTHILNTFNENELKVSDIITWENEYWLVTAEEKNTVKTHRTFIIDRCNRNLKFYNKVGKLMEIPCIQENKTLWTLGVKESINSQITVGDNKFNVILPDIEETKIIRNSFRLIGDEKAWKVASYTILRGYLSIMCEEVQIKDGLDDIVNEIPYNEFGVISITPTQPSISLTLGDTSKIACKVMQDTTEIQADLVYSTNDETIATIDKTGLLSAIGLGDVTITISLLDDLSVTATISCNVSASLTPSLTYDIISDVGFEIRKNVTGTFEGKKYDNGVEIPSSWTFAIDYMVMPTSSISLSSITSNSIDIKALSEVGVFKLVATESDGTIMEKEIKLKGGWV